MEFDFATNGSVDTLDKVPENFRGVYVKGDDGKFKINDSLKGVVDAVTGLNTALKASRKEASTLKGQKDVGAAVAEHFADLGLTDLDGVKGKITELTAALAEKGKVDPAKIKAEIERTFQAKETEYKGKLDKMQGTLRKHLIENAATTALAEAKGNVKLLLPHITAMADVVEDGDNYVVRIKDGAGDYRGNGAGGFMSVADVVKELKASKDFAGAFASENPGGGGKPGGQRTQMSRETSQRTQQVQDAPGDNPTSLIQRGLQARRAGR